MSMFPLNVVRNLRQVSCRPNLTALTCALLAATSVAAQDFAVQIELTGSQDIATVAKVDLLAAAGPDADPFGEIEVLVDPAFGQVTETASSVLYAPNPEFWTVGHDSFTYRAPAVQAGEYRLARVLIAAALHGGQGTLEDFEDPTFVLEPNPGFGPLRDTRSAMAGAYGLTVQPPQTTTPATLFATTVATFGGPSPGNGGDCIRVLPPPDNDGDPLIGRNPLNLINIGNGTFKVDMLSTSPLRITLTAAGATTIPYQTVEVAGDADSYLVHLDWWMAEGDGESNGGAMLFVNGEHVAGLRGLNNWELPYADQTWVTVEDSGNWNGLAVDDVDTRIDVNAPLPTGGYSGNAIKRVVARNDFQSGVADGWNAYQGYPHTVESDSRLGWEGNSKLRLDFADGDGSALHREPEAPLSSLSVAMNLDLSGLSMAEGDQVVLFGGADNPVPSHQNTIFRIHLVYQNGSHKIYISQRSTELGPWTFGNVVSVGPSSRIAAAWETATHPERSNGAMRLWIDGQLVTAKTGLDNYGSQIEGLRLGVRGVPTTFVGAVLIDDLEIWTHSQP